MVVFDVAALFNKAGGRPVDLQRLIYRHNGEAPRLATVQMWKCRERIAPAWLAAVLYAHHREGRPMGDFLVVPGAGKPLL
jgi:hypothetical protein